MTPLPPVDRDVLARAMTLAERSNWEPDPAKAAALREAARELWAEAHRDRRTALYRRALMSREPRINLDRLVNQIVLDCSLLRWFAFNGRRDDVTLAIALQRTRAQDTEGQVLDFLVRHCGGQQ